MDLLQQLEKKFSPIPFLILAKDVAQISIPFVLSKENFQIYGPEFLIPTAEATIRSFIPEAKFGQGRKLRIYSSWSENNFTGPLKMEVILEGSEAWSCEDREILDPKYQPADYRRRIKERMRLGLQNSLQRAFQLKRAPWGILQGVRPTKLVHSLFDRGFTQKKISELLIDVYGLAPDKRNLLLDVAERQRAFFHATPNQPIGIYIGIPFCPTRCSYCSFAAYPMASHGHLFDGFVQALKREILVIGDLIKELDLQVETIYLGGGTPTTLQGTTLAEILALIQNNLRTEATKEVTVEAGRPETLNLETLQIIQTANVDRISINPQSMHDSTLKAIGRNHTVRDVYVAFNLARQVGIPLINMDVILGLPGEDAADVGTTLQEIAQLKPDNLTVHSLALKRASSLRKTLDEVEIDQEQSEHMGYLAQQCADDLGMIPYYLYRQRHIFGGLENIGYARPGFESIYNIQMMEERQSILGLGGGAITKLVNEDHRLIRLTNPKCPATYSSKIEKDLVEKTSRIRAHFSR